MSYKATPLTSGSATIGADRKNYVYNGDKPIKDEPRAACADANASRRRARLARFEVVLTELAGDLEHASAADIRRAGELVGIALKTARTYRAELLRQEESSS